ncbi:toxin-antitoxin system TumE family protein [Duganella sp. S19_KUP01_CR8]|uniref:toxin-antitoxin system TumE family protein n=1 Tax=Duganella sp. S19_KUP01_CR8 TaxID=3025502 RepID=UPI002FCD9A32
MKIDPVIDTLLDLDGSVLDQGSGYWIKVEAKRTEVSDEVPHGVRYSLTLHDPYGIRILGYDNAHMVKPPKKFKYAGRILAFDHKHRHASDQGVPYEFKDAQQLFNDFFADVDRVLQELRK